MQENDDNNDFFISIQLAQITNLGKSQYVGEFTIGNNSVFFLLFSDKIISELKEIMPIKATPKNKKYKLQEREICNWAQIRSVFQMSIHNSKGKEFRISDELYEYLYNLIWRRVLAEPMGTGIDLTYTVVLKLDSEEQCVESIDFLQRLSSELKFDVTTMLNYTYIQLDTLKVS
ncbi:MAG: hypothetical protein A2725_02615 [Candidatus Magasanikbacteria bacterium RIFCSPHIGHO2_01_FULL_33_34]|uniref:Uncharacterized protein n=1 Tax=Candidatus Magasanikbacteria bacterium RIFCSPHIGHO2_01_FULL_33_34 TaxID=1798671 RepID=A0A1F6LGU9_9BACT|nr:MAG: hypothetical protein A2725_02615 [Candidatus Magasanikbacteria bacterium RIFCSPHIGHO2_01_FULL_33_34]OGH66031.1 MAG: hypothetical protein A3B83_00105 [Candidatus Magasanikbacteria bacterium RIFCSPHIGHO2_02_FULL_33_17]OGH75876.1 MAG: hypothetical protein A3A89_00015 [Candidatus Magasanikbacteria bacterium RIFCSPLOWO2_01_FULL_33_34]OGH80995.1 MAG: hypothetical protein A3F93_03890 [Candidatus Magasanikbacteria bacterium RIFCSPLOWO2_12_FULL_34_7]